MRARRFLSGTGVAVVMAGATVGGVRSPSAEQPITEERSGIRAPVAATPSALWEWDLPPDIAPPRVPDDNPMSAEKVELGRHLFYDTRLSGNETQSCASCHRQELAFTDGLARAVGSTGEVHPRGSMSLVNIAYSSTLTWGDPELRLLEEQQRGPLFGTEPVEMGMGGREEELLARLRASEVYPEMFVAAFPDDSDPITVERLLDAIAAFERTLISFDSPYDRYTFWGERSAMSREALAGAELFLSERMGCVHCHGEPFFTNSIDYEGKEVVLEEFFNTGLYDVDGEGGYPPPNTGVHAFTGDPEDMGRFRAPSLRNVAVTGPYMHDGSIETLDAVLAEHYMPGGRTGNPRRSHLMVRFGLTSRERAMVVSFLDALTDSTFLNDPRFSDPWEGRSER